MGLPRRRLGRTTLDVSSISLGTVEIGMEYGIPVKGACSMLPEGEAARLLHRALDLGVNFLDTARLYGDSEAIIGRALAGRRGEFYLASKAPSGADDLAVSEIRRIVTQSVHESLSALRTDVIDVMMIHSASVEVLRRGEVVAALEDLKRAGCVRFLGASVYGEETALLALRDGRYDCLQIAYSALDRRPEARIFAAAREAGAGLVARSVLLKGALTPRYRHLPEALADLKAAVQKLEALVGDEVESLVELSYRYVLSHTDLHTALVGAGNIRELEECIRFAGRGPLSAELQKRIGAIVAADENQLHPGTWPAEAK